MYKLLVVEDEVLIRDIIKEYFATRDYEVIEAVDGYDALDKVNQDSDMVLLDIMMQGGGLVITFAKEILDLITA